MNPVSYWQQLITANQDYLIAFAVFIGGWLIARWMTRALHTVLIQHFSPQHAMLTRRGVFYLLLAIATSIALDIAGANISVLLGAAGVLTIALGFAAQTSVSNLISGLFLMAERPFVIGDTIQTGTAFGEVVSIDLLSVKLRTFDNVLLRLPNEVLLKADIANWTRFPIRRIDYDMSFPASEPPERVREILQQMAENNELCLDEPSPVFLIRGLDASGYQVRFGVWTETTNFYVVKSRFFMEMLAAFREHGVLFGYPRRELMTPENLHVAVGTGEAKPSIETADD